MDYGAVLPPSLMVFLSLEVFKCLEQCISAVISIFGYWFYASRRVFLLPSFQLNATELWPPTVMNIICCIFCKCQLPSAGGTHDKYVEHLQVQLVQLTIYTSFNFSWDYNSAFRDGTWWLCKRRCQGQCRLQVQVLLRSQSPEVCSLARKLPTAVLQMLRKSPGLPSLQSVFLYQSVHQKLSQFKDLLHSLLVFKMAPMHYG